MIRVFIGSHKRFERVEPVIEYSIRKHASESVEVNIMRPEYYGYPDSGCTGFTEMRYKIPEICGYEGFAIYLDVDMILMDDIAKLWAYKKPCHWVKMHDGSSEVMVMDCNKESRYCSNSIPIEWNCEDCFPENWEMENAKLIHFTDLKCQPWFYDHPNKELAQIWFDMEKEALEANT
jgi:hypothetical protein